MLVIELRLLWQVERLLKLRMGPKPQWFEMPKSSCCQSSLLQTLKANHKIKHDGRSKHSARSSHWHLFKCLGRLISSDVSLQAKGLDWRFSSSKRNPACFSRPLMQIVDCWLSFDQRVGRLRPSNFERRDCWGSWRTRRIKEPLTILSRRRVLKAYWQIGFEPTSLRSLGRRSGRTQIQKVAAKDGKIHWKVKDEFPIQEIPTDLWSVLELWYVCVLRLRADYSKDELRRATRFADLRDSKFRAMTSEDLCSEGGFDFLSRVKSLRFVDKSVYQRTLSWHYWYWRANCADNSKIRPALQIVECPDQVLPYWNWRLQQMERIVQNHF